MSAMFFILVYMFFYVCRGTQVSIHMGICMHGCEDVRQHLAVTRDVPVCHLSVSQLRK